MKRVRLGLAQVNCKVGDLDGNSEKIIALIRQGIKEGVDIISFPEMAITGYPPEDLLFKPDFIKENVAALKHIATGCRGITAVIGFIDPGESGLSRSVHEGGAGRLFNAAAVIHDGGIRMTYHKAILPNYGVFDERRYFEAGTRPVTFDLGGVILGVNICEDIWHSEAPSGVGTITAGTDIIININASPFHAGKQREREKVLARRVAEKGVAIAYTNLVGGQDELVFDGGSMIMDNTGTIVASAPRFEETLLVTDMEVSPKEKFQDTVNHERCIFEGGLRDKTRGIKPHVAPSMDLLGEIYGALVLGTGDYVRKSGFRKVLIGLSGGIDSALAAAVAVDALGAENVMGIAMPSRYSSKGSIEDAGKLAENLNMEFSIIPIEKSFKALTEALSPLFEGYAEDVTEENLQARIRGNLLMALSNKFGRMVLTTGNKSEVSVGYSTLYGDMAGGFNVLKDVPKTTVYKLARHRNEEARCELIPENSITKQPSAELRPDQTDQDSLPPYEILDDILQKYVEEDLSAGEIVASGFERDIVERVIRLVDSNEYKRRQAAPGVKITPRAFGRDRRMPIVNGYRCFTGSDEKGYS